jgi:predicted transcriptional regulator
VATGQARSYIDVLGHVYYIVFIAHTKVLHMANSTETFSIRLPDATRKNIDKLAALSKRSRSYIINEAVEAFVNDRMAYLNDLDTAVRSAETGPGHSSEQIFGWMRTWGKPDEHESPPPDLPKSR